MDNNCLNYKESVCHQTPDVEDLPVMNFNLEKIFAHHSDVLLLTGNS